jgi:hypothetical protein
MENFTPVPNEWVDQLADGRLTVPMFTILCLLMRTCTWSTGVWKGTAERMQYALNGELGKRQISRYLKRLHACGYITSHSIPGKRKSYKIDLNNFVAVRDEVEIVLRPTELKDWQELPADHDADDDAEMTSTMTLRRRRDDEHDDAEMTSNPDVPDVPNTIDLPNVPKVPNQVSKQDSKQVPSSEENTAVRSVGSEEQTPVPSTVVEFWSDDLVAMEAKELLLRFKPHLTDHLVKEQLPMAIEILSLVPEDMDALDLVVWNQAHRSHKYATKDDKRLFLRSPKQMLAALKHPNANLVNDYDTHLFDECPICKEKGLVHTKVLRAVLEANHRESEAQRQAELLAIEEAERAAAELAAKRERWSKYDWSRKRNDDDRKTFNFNREFESKKISDAWGGKAPESVLDASVIYFASLGRPFSWSEFEQTFMDIWEARKDWYQQQDARDATRS